MPILLLFAAACAPPPDSAVPDVTRDTEGFDSARDTAENPPPTVAFDLAGPLDGLAFSLVHAPVTDDGLRMGAVVIDAPAAARVELRPDALPYVMPLPDVEGLTGAFFVGGLHEDDGNGRWDAEERWFAAGSWMALYLEGELPELFALAGMQLGWNGILIDGEAIPAIGDPLALPLENGWVESLTLAGTASAGLPSGAGLALVPVPVFAGDAVSSLLVDEPVTDPWVLSVSDAPEPSHLYDLDGDGFAEAVEVFAVYTDTDASGGWTPGDAGLGGLCALDGLHAERGVGLYYSPPSTNVLWPVYAAVAGAALGWNAFAADPADESLHFLPPEALTGLVASEACELE